MANLLDEIYLGDLKRAEERFEACRVVYVKSHIRTRQWFKAGATFLWQDGEDNDDVKYRPAKTTRKVRRLE